MIATALLLAALLQPAAGDPLAARLQAQANVYEMRRPSPGIHFSPRAAAAYAMSSGCVPAVATGRPATEFFQTAASGRGRDREGVHSVSVTVALTEDTHGCTVLAKAGEPEELREAVLRALDDEGAVRTVVSDSGAGSRDSSGAFRQELHCLTLNGRPMFLVMSTSSASNRPRLMASLGADAAGDCGRRSAG